MIRHATRRGVGSRSSGISLPGQARVPPRTPSTFLVPHPFGPVLPVAGPWTRRRAGTPQGEPSWEIPSATRVPSRRSPAPATLAPFAPHHSGPLAAPWTRPRMHAASATVHGQPQPLSPAQAARRAIPAWSLGRPRRTAESQPTASRRERLRAGVTRCPRARAAAGEARRTPRPAPRSGTG